MGKKLKLSLNDITVNSFITEKANIKGGVDLSFHANCGTNEWNGCEESLHNVCDTDPTDRTDGLFCEVGSNVTFNHICTGGRMGC